MGRVIACSIVAMLVATTLAPAQTRRTPAPTPQRGRAATTKPPAPPPTVKVAATITCPAPLGIGAKTGLAFCDVLTVRDPAEGIIVAIPPHEGPVTLTFDLHNRHTYSEEQERANRGFARYTASIGVMMMDVTLLTRGVVQNEYRKPADLLDRVGGGAGPSGLKAVAPTGIEHVTVLIPETESKVSILGEKLTVERFDASSATYATIGRPIAVVSNVMLEFRQPPPPPAAPAAGRRGRL